MKKLQYIFGFLLMVSISFTAFASNDSDNISETEIRKDAELVKVYPNPFASSLNLELGWNTEESTTVRIFNIIGKQIFLKEFEPSSLSIHVDTKEFEKGIYFVEVKNGNYMDTQRIIKK
ncbi:MAG: T9SS type A sorting domain-containing protein [Bacteroidia bacterium]|nr:T9SS type A sorting domain-containing protein [Bacteroidia bacterium]NNC86551.1 T9SS type A sorting domain-containing protein [Bacteroidia bacterium]NNM15628.1 T9SS type A sorting domain-containing protein [Bacteroidia bacterium]